MTDKEPDVFIDGVGYVFVKPHEVEGDIARIFLRPQESADDEEE